ncbi:MAG: hypothetical protein J1E82_09845 [Muribaculaceae bacterium]|nr:hypothetical protein [Muribaculaceae bacterium]
MTENNPAKQVAGSESDSEPSLQSLFNEAYSAYRTEVIGKGILYDRFADDFINGHKYFIAGNVEQANQQNQNLNIIGTLILHRKDLVEKYFSADQFDTSDFNAMLNEFNTTNSKQPVQHKDTTLVTNNFGASFSPSQIAILTSIANDCNIFKGRVTEDVMAALFSPNPDVRLIAHNNRKLVIFFDTLAEDNLINRNWQKTIADSGIIASSSDTPFSQPKLSSALNGAKSETNAGFDTIRKRVKEVANTK